MLMTFFLQYLAFAFTSHLEIDCVQSTSTFVPYLSNDEHVPMTPRVLLEKEEMMSLHMTMSCVGSRTSFMSPFPSFRFVDRFAANPLEDNEDIISVVLSHCSDQGFLFLAGVSKS